MTSEKTKDILVLYHIADNDGVMSGVIANYYISKNGHRCCCVGVDYHHNFEQRVADETSRGPNSFDEIYILDVSNVEFMEKYGSKIIYIDHHYKAIETAPKVKDRHCIDGVAACRLTLDYFTQSPNHVFHDKEFFVERKNDLEPLVVAILGEYDIWDKTSPLAEKLNFGLEPKFAIVDYFFRETKSILVGKKKFDVEKVSENKTFNETGLNYEYLNYLINKGEGALDYVKSTKDKVTPVKFKLNGFNGVWINTHIKSSLVYDLASDEDFLMVFTIKKDKDVSVSFYSNKPEVNCYDLASKFGGGGHRGAAGCTIGLGTLFDIIHF